MRVEQALGVVIGVIISDTFGRPWRRGLTDIAIGVSGVEAVRDMKGQTDWSGRTLEVTEVAVADELAAAADLVMGKSDGIPAALIKGYVSAGPSVTVADLTRPAGEDLFR
jgi:coenzyme F420-0:L-glutamate ligase/coenzyme F420-1:gamma-L-glutamate ligase